MEDLSTEKEAMRHHVFPIQVTLSVFVSDESKRSKYGHFPAAVLLDFPGVLADIVPRPPDYFRGR